MLDLPLRAIGSCRGDPNNVDVAGATARGIPVLQCPGPQRRRRRRARGRSAPRSQPRHRGRRPRRPRRRGLSGRDAPLSALPRVGARRTDGRDRRVGRGRAGGALALRGPRHARHRARPLRAGRDPLARRPPRPSRCRVDARCRHPRDGRDDRCATQFASMREGAVYLNCARAQLHDTDALVARAAVRARSAVPGSTTSSGRRSPATTRSADCPNVVLTPHIGGATYDTETNHTDAIVHGLVTLLAGGTPAEPRQPGGLGVSEREHRPVDEVKDPVLRVAQEMLTSGLVEGTAGQRRCPAPRRQRRAHAVVAQLPHHDGRRPRGLRSRGRRDRRSPQPHLRASALHLTALRTYPELNATMHCHAKFATMFALTRRPIPAVVEEFVVYVGGDVPVAALPDDRERRARRRGLDAPARPQRRAHGQPRALRDRQGPGRRAPHRRVRGTNRRDRVGRRTAGRDRRLAGVTQTKFASYYRFGRTGSF